MSRAQPSVRIDEREIDAIFSDLDQCHFPGAAVGIAVGGRPVYRRGFGLASMDLPVVLTPATRAGIHSTTKHFAALAYMLLCEDGKAGIDDPLGKHLPDIHPASHPPTMRQLMGNISGLRDAHEIYWHFSGTMGWDSSWDLLSMYRTLDDTNYPPGSAWLYSNGNFLLLSAVIERLSGMTLEDFLRTRIFDPIGMYDSVLHRSTSSFLPNCATPHMGSVKEGFSKVVPSVFAGEGGIVSTVDDMLRWLAHMDAPKVGSAATWDLMKTTQRLANGTPTGYGLGLALSPYRGVPQVWHAGGGKGGTSQMLKVPSAGLDVVVIANRSDVFAFTYASRILDSCLSDLATLPTAYEGPIASGTFRSPKTGLVMRLFAKEGKQHVTVFGNDEPMEPGEDGVLRPIRPGCVDYFQLAVTLVGDRERPDAIRFSEYGNVDELVRIDPPAGAEALSGQFACDAAGVECTIQSGPHGTRMEARGAGGTIEYDLERLAEGCWKAAKADPRQKIGNELLIFDGDGGFRLWTYTTRGLRFRRRS